MEENEDTSLKSAISSLEARLTSWLLKRTREKEYIPPQVFDELLGTIPGTALEVVPFYVDDSGDINVFLTKRNKKDRYWPNLWHSPGTMVLNKDESEGGNFSKAWERLKKSELMKESLSDPVPVSVKFVKTKRGMETAYIHFILVPKDLKSGRYFPVDRLPKDLVDHHLELIKEASYDLYASYLSGRINLDKTLNPPLVKQDA